MLASPTWCAFQKHGRSNSDRRHSQECVTANYTPEDLSQLREGGEGRKQTIALNNPKMPKSALPICREKCSAPVTPATTSNALLTHPLSQAMPLSPRLLQVQALVPPTLTSNASVNPATTSTCLSHTLYHKQCLSHTRYSNYMPQSHPLPQSNASVTPSTTSNASVTPASICSPTTGTVPTCDTNYCCQRPSVQPTGNLFHRYLSCTHRIH